MISGIFRKKETNFLGVAPNPSILTKSQYLSSKKEKKEGFSKIPRPLDRRSTSVATRQSLSELSFALAAPSVVPLKGLHLSLCSLSSGEGKIENFEKPSFSKIW